MNKKLLLLVASAFLLAGCGNNTPATTSAPATEAPTTVAPATETPATEAPTEEETLPVDIHDEIEGYTYSKAFPSAEIKAFFEGIGLTHETEFPAIDMEDCYYAANPSETSTDEDGYEYTSYNYFEVAYQGYDAMDQLVTAFPDEFPVSMSALGYWFGMEIYDGQDENVDWYVLIMYDEEADLTLLDIYDNLEYNGDLLAYYSETETWPDVNSIVRGATDGLIPELTKYTGKIYSDLTEDTEEADSCYVILEGDHVKDYAMLLGDPWSYDSEYDYYYCEEETDDGNYIVTAIQLGTQKNPGDKQTYTYIYVEYTRYGIQVQDLSFTDYSVLTDHWDDFNTSKAPETVAELPDFSDESIDEWGIAYVLDSDYSADYFCIGVNGDQEQFFLDKLAAAGYTISEEKDEYYGWLCYSPDGLLEIDVSYYSDASEDIDETDAYIYYYDDLYGDYDDYDYDEEDIIIEETEDFTVEEEEA